MCFGGGAQKQQNAMMVQQAQQSQQAQQTAAQQVAAQNEANRMRQEEIDMTREARMADMGQRLQRGETAPDDANVVARKDAVARARRSYGGGNRTLLTAGSLGGYYAPGEQKTLIGS